MMPRPERAGIVNMGLTQYFVDGSFELNQVHMPDPASSVSLVVFKMKCDLLIRRVLTKQVSATFLYEAKH